MRIPLTGGSYTAKSIVADAQRCVNLYPEKNPEDAPFPFTHYPTPGLVYAGGGSANVCRCIYRASTGDVYAVYGNVLGKMEFSGNTFVGLSAINNEFNVPLITPGSNIMSMSDNGMVLIIVDGTTNGYCLDMATNDFAIITGSTEGPFYGADKVDYIDTFFVFNRPGTNQWYISLSDANFEMMTTVFGAIQAGEISGAGSGYTDGTYNNVTLGAGSGAGAQATIVVLGGIVTQVNIVSAGSGYVVGDELTASVIGAGTGFQYDVLQIGGAFDPLDIATKNGGPDNITSLIVMHREVWLIGVWTSEVWYNSGAADFTFQSLPGAFIEHGCVAKYSLCAQDLSVYFVSQDRQGQGIVMKGSEYQVKRISTHAMEAEFVKYPTLSDAIGFTYQQEGHTFYVLTFPSADKTWVYDESTELWHERAWTDQNGNLHRIRANAYGFAKGTSFVGDWQNRGLYIMDSNHGYDSLNNVTGSENGPITRIRSFPHMLDDLNRVIYNSFVADMDVGNETQSSDLNGDTYPPAISLRYSDNRGRTYGNAIQQSLGAEGEYLTNISWNRLGLARDRVFELSWACPGPTALNGAYVEIQKSST